MERFLASLSRNVIAFGALGLGILFIVANDPPKTVCDAQLDLFKAEEKGFLFRDAENKTRKTASFPEYLNRCKSTNTPGGCYELFHRLRHQLRSMDAVPKECVGELSELSPVKASIWEGLGLIVRIAWGDKPPANYYEKQGWLDAADMNLYCQLKKKAQRFYGKDRWTEFQESLFQELPGAKEISREKAWESMLLSVNCQQFL